jgi:drug/metabolite transporter (DMT)-like permease
MNSTGVAFGLGAAATWGSSDFGGGLAGQKVSPLAVVVLSQAIGLVIAIGILAAAGEPFPGSTPLGWAMLGGASGIVCLTSLYRALATRPMGPVSAISTIVGVSLPVAVGAVTGDRLRPQDALGIVLAFVAIVLVTRPSGSVRLDRAGLGLAVLSGIGAGGFFIAIGQSTDAGGGTWWPLIAARSTSVVLAILLTVGMRQVGPTVRGLSPLIASVGIVDMAGTACFIFATSQGALSLAAVVSSQYPAVTTLLARVVLKQHLGPAQIAGIVAALAGIALISVP